MSRLAPCFEKLAAEKRAGLVTFTMAYDPDLDTSLEILQGMPGAGADIVELGIPFSDPMADGPIIQEAGRRALKNGATLRGVLDMCRRFRNGDKATPLILMGYYNPIFAYGVEDFARDAVKAGVDGVIIVDLPPEESEEFTRYAGEELPIIRLIAPTTPEARRKAIAESARGFLYYVSIRGITGTTSSSEAEVQEAVQALREVTQLPVAVGFGVRTASQAKKLARHADAVVVGSALVSRIEESSQGGTADAVLALTSELAEAIHATEHGAYQPGALERLGKMVKGWWKRG